MAGGTDIKKIPKDAVSSSEDLETRATTKEMEKKILVQSRPEEEVEE